MKSTFHRWWLGSCVAALLLASWVGGFSVSVTSVFIVIYLTGVTLIGPDEAADVVAGEPVDVVAAEPGWMAAFNTNAAAVPEPAADDKGEPEPPVSAEVADEGETPADKKAAEDETPAEETKAETPKDEKSTEEPKAETRSDEKSADDDTALAIAADGEADTEGPADTETVIVYESAAAAEQETVIVEDATESDTGAEVTFVDDDDDVLPYPDDFDDEADVGERSPA